MDHLINVPAQRDTQARVVRKRHVLQNPVLMVEHALSTDLLISVLALRDIQE